METENRGVTMADTPLVWEDLAKYKAEGRFLDGYPDDQRTFFAPRDNVHGLLAALLDSAQHSIVVNMFGYDDDELNKIIQGKLVDEKIYVQMSLDRSQSTGAHEKQILASWANDAFGNSIAIGTSSVHNAISHLKIVIGEAGTGWIPYILDRMDAEWEDQFRELDLKMNPSKYWYRQCYATYQSDPVGVKLLEELGEDNIMWGSDFPHPDGIYPDSQEYIEKELGRTEAMRIARKFSKNIEYTGNWDENYADKYASVADLLKRQPQELKKLYFDTFKYLDDPKEVALLQKKGYDGAIHIGNGETSTSTEYRIFDLSQVRSAITGFGGGCSPAGSVVADAA